ncbi:MAG: hypothetical protein AAFV07_05810, partial [Bacteroidota bacterium]
MNSKDLLLSRICLRLVALIMSAAWIGSAIAQNYTFQPARVGGGGFVIEIVAHPTQNNLLFARTDVGGAYKWNAGNNSWEQLINASAMPNALMTDQQPNGKEESAQRASIYECAGIAVARTNSNIIYIAGGSNQGNGTDPENGFLIKSSNGGNSFTLTSLRVPTKGNGEQRKVERRLAIDPRNANVVFYGTLRSGLRLSTNGGSSWSLVGGGLPSSTPLVSLNGNREMGHNYVVFDYSSGSITINGQTRTR